MAPEESVQPCDTRLLCRGPLGAVTRCVDCGQLHLSLSYLTLRLQPDAFRELVGMLALALQQLPSAPPHEAVARAASALH